MYRKNRGKMHFRAFAKYDSDFRTGSPWQNANSRKEDPGYVCNFSIRPCNTSAVKESNKKKENSQSRRNWFLFAGFRPFDNPVVDAPGALVQRLFRPSDAEQRLRQDSSPEGIVLRGVATVGSKVEKLYGKFRSFKSSLSLSITFHIFLLIFRLIFDFLFLFLNKNRKLI